jgi:hypothetical protein
LPAGLRRDHRIARGTWGVLRAIDGCAHLTMQTEPPLAREVCAGETQAIPPGVRHAVSLSAGSIAVDFLVSAPRQATD